MPVAVLINVLSVGSEDSAEGASVILERNRFAWRTIRRCTLCLFARRWIVSPVAYPRRIFSNSSTLPLLSIPKSCHPG